MDITCQYCGTTASSDRVMCPSCKRRMRPVDGGEPGNPAGSAPTPEPTPTTNELPPPWQPPDYYSPPTYAATPPQQPPAYPPYGAPQPLGYQPYPQQPAPQHFYPLPPQHGPWGGPLKPTVLFDRASTVKVSRPTVAFRLILAIPFYVILVVLNLALALAGLASWLAAVFTARVPVGLYNFMGYVTGYFLRFNSYLAALTDKWPTLSANDPYPAVVRYPGPERLNRAAVIFRLILAIPVTFLSTLVTYGLYILLIPIWVITASYGRMPRPIFDAASAAVRYQTRFQAYFFLLTSAYPSELFVPDQQDPGSPIEQRPELLPPLRSKGGHRLLVTMIGLGVIGLGVQFTFQYLPPIISAVRDVVAENDLSNAYDNVHLDTPANCPTGPEQLRCLQADDAAKINELRVFDSKVAGLDINSSSKPYVAVLRAETATLINDYQRLTEAPTLAVYHQDAALLPLVISDFEEAEDALDVQLLGN